MQDNLKQTPYFLTLLTTIGCLLSSNMVWADKTICGNNQQANQLVQLIMTHKNQQRNELTCNAKLSAIAAIKAQHITKDQNIWHHAGRMSPNQLLRHHGYKLPKTYSLLGNQVEALAGGTDDHNEVFADFLTSEPHKNLLLGIDDFFQLQDQIGAAYIYNADTEHESYWVVIIAGDRMQTLEQKPVLLIEPLVINKKRRRGRHVRDRFYRNKLDDSR